MSLIENFDCHGCSGDILCENHFQEVCVQQVINQPVVTENTYTEADELW